MAKITIEINGPTVSDVTVSVNGTKVNGLLDVNIRSSISDVMSDGLLVVHPDARQAAALEEALKSCGIEFRYSRKP